VGRLELRRAALEPHALGIALLEQLDLLELLDRLLEVAAGRIELRLEIAGGLGEVVAALDRGLGEVG
jgi:hypothetical protein